MVRRDEGNAVEAPEDQHRRRSRHRADQCWHGKAGPACQAEDGALPLVLLNRRVDLHNHMTLRAFGSEDGTFVVLYEHLAHGYPVTPCHAEAPDRVLDQAHHDLHTATG
jgi:hypothetical protein